MTTDRPLVEAERYPRKATSPQGRAWWYTDRQVCSFYIEGHGDIHVPTYRIRQALATIDLQAARDAGAVTR